MGLVSDFVHELFPFLRDSLRDGVHAVRTTKRRRRHLFVLKAMGRPSTKQLARDITGMRFDLASIDRQVLLAQLDKAFPGNEGIGDAVLLMERKKENQRQFDLLQKLGIPDIEAPDRRQKLEVILHDMVEAGKLRFHPPDMWSVP